ncbi:MAG: chemotaxis protein CheX [Thermodesulfobacteriota bacterium]|nr:chemotaxis protein CheX [Thermodesulfobacteriota bacterium]
MDAKLVNPFIHATMNVLKTMAFVACKADKPYLKKDDIACGDVSGVIGFTGETNGTVAVTFDEPSILKIVTNMFGEEMNSLNDEVVDAVGELTNMISGQARRELEEAGRFFEAAIPSVIHGKGHTITHYTDGPKIAIPFSTEDGNFTIEVCMEKSDE